MFKHFLWISCLMGTSLQEAQQLQAFKCRIDDEIAKEILQKVYFIINSQDEYGDTSLMEASRRGKHEEVEKLLAENPKSIDIQDENGMSALMHALYEGEEEIAKDLVSKTDLSKKDNFGWTVLHYAVRLGSIHMVQLFLRISNIKVDAQDIFGQTPLTIAAKVNPEILRTLKQYKCRRKKDYSLHQRSDEELTELERKYLLSDFDLGGIHH